MASHSLMSWRFILFVCAIGTFVRSQELAPTCKTQTLECFADYTREGRQFVAVTDDVAIIGGPSAGTGGEAYVYRREGVAWVWRQTLRAPDARAGDAFGTSVAIRDDVAVIGAPLRNCASGSDCGAAYVFRLSGTVWTLDSKLSSSDVLAYDRFGTSVAIHGDVAFIGAPGRACSAGPSCGKVYVYRYRDSGWIEDSSLSIPDSTSYDLFGDSVSTSGEVAVIGARGSNCCGAAHIFRYDGSTWLHEQKVVGELGVNAFGWAVAVNGNAVLVTAPSSNGAAFYYRFEHETGSWALRQLVRGSRDSHFGISLSMTSELAVIGAYGEVGGGAAYVYLFNGTRWDQVQRLTTAGQASLFGGAVSTNGTLAMVSAGYQCPIVHSFLFAPDCNENGDVDFCETRDARARDINESAVPDECEPDVPTQCELEKLVASDAHRDDQFGVSVAADGDIALVGANAAENPPGLAIGAAYLYRPTELAWEEVGKLTPPDEGEFNQFAGSVSLSGELAVVGASEAGCPEGPSCGAAYVYRFDGAAWPLQQRLSPSDSNTYDRFGASVAVDGNAVVAGSYWSDCTDGDDCGAAYVFRFDGSSWLEEQKLIASDAGAGELFGYSVALHSDLAVVGAVLSDCGAGPACGAAYVFRHGDTGWREEQKLVAPDANAFDQAGVSVAIGENVALVAGWLADCPAGENCGAVHVYRFDGATWAYEQTLTASDAAAGDGFGRSVALRGHQALIGAYRAGCANAADCGAAYLYRFNGSDWTEERKLTAPAGAALDYFGLAVALGEDFALAGAYADNCPAGTLCGSAYAFRLGGDCNENERVDLCDTRDGRSDDVDDDGVPDECETILATLDIKPEACPNVVNLKSQGVLTAVLTGDSDIDATQVDTATLALRRADGVGGSAEPLTGPPGPGIHFADLASPSDTDPCDCSTAGPDGVGDLLMRFNTSELAEALDLHSLPAGSSITLTLTGALLDGTLIEASDCIVLPGASSRPLSTNLRDSPSLVPSIP